MAELLLFAIVILAASYVAYCAVVVCLEIVFRAVLVLCSIARKAVCHD